MSDMYRNEDAALAMSEVVGDNTKRIYLAHLSMDNNMKDLARMSVEQTLKQRESSWVNNFPFMIQIRKDQRNLLHYK